MSFGGGREVVVVAEEEDGGGVGSDHIGGGFSERNEWGSGWEAIWLSDRDVINGVLWMYCFMRS